MLKNTFKSTIVATSVLVSIGLTGCASNDPVRNYAELQQEMHEAAVKKEQQRFEAVPEWFLNPPQNDETGIYAVGTATSNNLQFSMNQAKLNAEFGLAKTLSQEVAGRERQFMRSGANGNVESTAESVVTKFVDAADIVGVNNVENKVQLIDGQYTVYSLMHLSYDQQAKILARKRGDTTLMSAKQAYEEIEAELRRRKEEKRQAVQELQSLKGDSATTESPAQSGTL